MAGVAVDRQSRVLIIGMASGALHAGMRTRERELGFAVIERGAGPIRRGMAQ